MSDQRPSIAFTVDVECWGQSVLDRTLPILPHAADNARRVIQLLAECDATATLFVLGKFAERHPDVVREAHAAGHEIASHGYGHIEVFKLSPDAFRDDLHRSRDILEDLIGESVRGYRAPVFSIGRGNLWALDVLAEVGFTYDASIFPFEGPRYGIGDWPAEPCCVEFSSQRRITEYPATVTMRLGKRWPIAGGGYARLLPGSVLVAALACEAQRRSAPPVFYCHPYELDPDELPRCYPQVRGKRRLHQALGRRGFEQKLRKLLKQFRGVSMGEALKSCGKLPSMQIDGGASSHESTGALQDAPSATAGHDSRGYAPEPLGSGASMYS